MEIYNHPLSLRFIKHVLNSFKKKHSLIRLTHNYFLKNKKISGKTIDLGSGENSNLSYNEFLDIKDAKIENSDFFKKSEKSINLENKIPIEDNTFENILLFNTLEHIENYKNLISEIFRILKRDGKLELFVPFLVMYHPDPNDIFRPTHYYLEKILRENGFEVKISLIGVGPFFSAYQNFFRYFKFPIFQTIFFLLFDILNRLVKIFSKDYINYYCGIHASCNKK